MGRRPIACALDEKGCPTNQKHFPVNPKRKLGAGKWKGRFAISDIFLEKKTKSRLLLLS
jgi:hypothetical protein